MNEASPSRIRRWHRPLAVGRNRVRLRHERDLYGGLSPIAASPIGLLADWYRWGPLGLCIWQSRRIRGWTRGEEAVELARSSHGLEGTPTLVEVGSFLGCSAVLLAGARRLKGSGRLHCVDPFAASGDAFSVPIYRRIAASLSLSLRDSFEANIRSAGLSDLVVVHEATALEAAAKWTLPIDLLLLDGDQSPEGARATFLAWSPFLKPGGILVVSNSADAPHESGHDGSQRVVREFVRPAAYEGIRCVQTTTFAMKSRRLSAASA